MVKKLKLPKRRQEICFFWRRQEIFEELAMIDLQACHARYLDVMSIITNRKGIATNLLQYKIRLVYKNIPSILQVITHFPFNNLHGLHTLPFQFWDMRHTTSFYFKILISPYFMNFLSLTSFPFLSPTLPPFP